MDPSPQIARLNAQFGIPQRAQVVAGHGGLAKVQIDAPTACGEIYLHGAHVTAWHPRGADEVLFVSQQSLWQDGKAIRGGVPICFPWFAGKADDATAPAHGVVRTVGWQLESIHAADDAVVVRMATASAATSKRWFAGDFQAVLQASFGATLALDLTIINTGNEPLRYEEALHAYFTVGQIQAVRLRGLDGVEYIDKTAANRRHVQQGEIDITAETDRIYLNTAAAVEIDDAALRRTIRVSKQHSLSTVVWNPWIAKAQAMADFGDQQWPHMICVETCNVGEHAVQLAPGQQHTLRMAVDVIA